MLSSENSCVPGLARRTEELSTYCAHIFVTVLIPFHQC
uniref:Uncharacterized protein n=1 Tax=Anguilla anguilla TaxID=7936 RepID=A0A0E9VWD7_ANGAN